MSKLSNRLLIVALLSACAAAATGSAAAKEKHDDNDRSKQSRQEQYAKFEQSRAERHDKDRSGHEHDHDNDAAQMTPRISVVTVTNRGASPLTITAPPTVTRVSGNGSFAIVPPGAGTPCATSLVVSPRGGNCTIGVQYTPTDGERSTARLTLTDSGAATATQEALIKSD